MTAHVVFEKFAIQSFVVSIQSFGVTRFSCNFDIQAVIFTTSITRSWQASIRGRIFNGMVFPIVVHQRFFTFGVHHARGREFCIGRGCNRLISTGDLILLVFSILMYSLLVKHSFMYILDGPRDSHTKAIVCRHCIKPRPSSSDETESRSKERCFE